MVAISSLAAAAIVVVASTGIAMAQSSQLPTAPADQFSSFAAPVDGKGALEFWTAEQFKQAKPMPMLVVEPSAQK